MYTCTTVTQKEKSIYNYNRNLLLKRNLDFSIFLCPKKYFWELKLESSLSVIWWPDCAHYQWHSSGSPESWILAPCFQVFPSVRLLLKQAACPSNVGNDCHRDILDTQGVEQLLGQGHSNEDHRCIGPHRNSYFSFVNGKKHLGLPCIYSSHVPVLSRGGLWFISSFSDHQTDR